MYELSACFEKLSFPADTYPVADVGDYLWIEEFCSYDCRATALRSVLAKYDIPVRYPGSGPIETCARCGAPVDMTAWHLAVYQVDMLIECEDVLRPTNATLLAVLCRRCCHMQTGAEVVSAFASTEAVAQDGKLA
jgi:hypothetical protein